MPPPRWPEVPPVHVLRGTSSGPSTGRATRSVLSSGGQGLWQADSASTELSNTSFTTELLRMSITWRLGFRESPAYIGMYRVDCNQEIEAFAFSLAMPGP